VLDPEPRVNRPEPALAIPSKGDAAPLPAPAQKSSPPAAPAKAPEVAPVAKALAPPAPAKAAGAPKPPVPAVVAAAPVVTPKLEGFAVQVGAFKEDAKLAQAREKLTAAKISHYIERLATASGDLTRLRAGPFPTREAAEKAAGEVKRAGLDGRVVPLP
jgi:DedD protein